MIQFTFSFFFFFFFGYKIPTGIVLSRWLSGKNSTENSSNNFSFLYTTHKTSLKDHKGKSSVLELGLAMKAGFLNEERTHFSRGKWEKLRSDDKNSSKYKADVLYTEKSCNHLQTCTRKFRCGKDGLTADSRAAERLRSSHKNYKSGMIRGHLQ